MSSMVCPSPWASAPFRNCGRRVAVLGEALLVLGNEFVEAGAVEVPRARDADNRDQSAVCGGPEAGVRQPEFFGRLFCWNEFRHMQHLRCVRVWSNADGEASRLR